MIAFVDFGIAAHRLLENPHLLLIRVSLSFESLIDAQVQLISLNVDFLPGITTNVKLERIIIHQLLKLTEALLVKNRAKMR